MGTSGAAGAAGAAVDFCLLGPVTVRRAGRPVALRSLRQRTLLAVLLVHRGEVVPVDTLVDALWAERPPRTARNTLQAHVGALRHRLSGRPDRDLVRTVPRGYQLRVDRDRVDAGRFEELVRAARAARDAGRPERAAADLRAALALWHGPALADVPSPALAGAAAALDEARRLAYDERVDLDLRLGRHAGLPGELRARVAADPLRERSWEQLVLALYRGGRRADALLAYRDADARLRAEVGVGPSPPLSELHARVLAADPALDWTPPRTPAPRPAAGPPAPTPAAPDRAGAIALRRRGGRLVVTGDWPAAADCLAASATALRRAGDRPEEAVSRLHLAALWWLRGEWDRATDGVLDCLPALLDGADAAAADGLSTLAVLRLRLGDPAAAVELFRRALDRSSGPDGGEAAYTRVHLALAHRAAGARDRAEPGPALRALRRAGRPLLEAHALPEAALVERAAGDLRTAGAHLVRGLRQARLAGDPLAEGVALYGFGEVHTGAGRVGPAARCLDRAVDRFGQLGAPYWRSRALLARAALADRQRRPADSRRDRAAAAGIRVPAAELRA